MKANSLMTGLMSLLLLSATTAALGAEPESGGGGGGGGGGSVACQPAIKLNAKGDARVGETGLSSVQVGWSVKPCAANPAVRVETTITSWTTKTVVYSDVNAAQNGKITLYVAPRQSYQFTVKVLDVPTGAVLSTSSVFASTVPKGGV